MKQTQGFIDIVNDEVAEYADMVCHDQVALEEALAEVRSYKLGRTACSSFEQGLAGVVMYADKALRGILSGKMIVNHEEKQVVARQRRHVA